MSIFLFFISVHRVKGYDWFFVSRPHSLHSTSNKLEETQYIRIVNNNTACVDCRVYYQTKLEFHIDEVLVFSLSHVLYYGIM